MSVDECAIVAVALINAYPGMRHDGKQDRSKGLTSCFKPSFHVVRNSIESDE